MTLRMPTGIVTLTVMAIVTNHDPSASGIARLVVVTTRVVDQEMMRVGLGVGEACYLDA